MNRGAVMEITGDSAIVLTPDGEFVRIKADASMTVGQEVIWNDENRMTGGSSFGVARTMRRWAVYGGSAAVIVLMVIAVVFGVFRSPEVVAYVSMDVNPSVEIGLDAKERVQALRAVNQDAETVVADIIYRGEPVEHVMNALAANLVAANYLNPSNGEIVIASVQLRPVDEQWESRVTDKIRQVLEQVSEAVVPEDSDTGLTIETVFLPVEVRQEAEENGVSAGKMALWLAAGNSGHYVDLQELREDSVQQIAASRGGLKQVMKEGKPDKSDKESWKQMLNEARQKNGSVQASKSESDSAPKGSKDTATTKSGEKNGKGRGSKPDSTPSTNGGKADGKGRGAKPDSTPPTNGGKADGKGRGDGLSQIQSTAKRS